jgi:hypothetical protein
MDIANIIVIGIAICAVCFVLWMRRGTPSTSSLRHSLLDDEFIPADEAGPTPTGKFRVQQMLHSTLREAPTESAGAAAQMKDPVEDSRLPDPFSLDTDEEKKE